MFETQLLDISVRHAHKERQYTTEPQKTKTEIWCVEHLGVY